MAYETKEGQGSLFKNDRKAHDAQPEYKGRILVGGVEYWLSAWVKTGEKGKWMSLAATPKDAKAEKPAEPTKGDAFEDDIPF